MPARPVHRPRFYLSGDEWDDGPAQFLERFVVSFVSLDRDVLVLAVGEHGKVESLGVQRPTVGVGLKVPPPFIPRIIAVSYTHLTQPTNRDV